MTPQTRNSLLGFASSVVAGWVEKCRVQAGRGVQVEGESIRLPGPREDAATPQTVRKPERMATLIPVERRGKKLYFNVPPVFGVVPRLNGQSLFANPQPFLPLPVGQWHVYLRVGYYRSGVSIAREAEGADPVTAGLLIGNVQVDVLLIPYGQMVMNVTPTNSGSDSNMVTPYPGQYVRAYILADVIDGDVRVYPFSLPSWGGWHETTVASYGESRWGFPSVTVWP